MRRRYWATALAVVSAVGVAWLTDAVGQGAQRVAAVTYVIDGDTFEIAGGARVRVRNFDTPELRDYDCAEERRLARAARDAARRTLSRKRVTLTVAGEDRYGRLVADVTVHEGAKAYDFAERMMAQGHGARWRFGFEPQPEWCAQSASSDGWGDLEELGESAGGGLAGWLSGLFN